MTRGTGYRPERAGSRLMMARPDQTPVGAIPNEGGFDHAPWVLDQRGNSCTGHTAAGMVHLLTGERGSPYLPYWFGLAHDLGIDAIADVGVSMGGLVEAYEKHGVCDWDQWRPGVEGFGVTEKPPALARANAQKRNLDVAVLFGFGNALVERACSELAEQHPLGIVVSVDDDFDRADDVIGPERGPSRGLHIITGRRYRTVGGERQIEVVNSWSAGWGNGGLQWLSAARVAQSPFICSARGVS